MNQLSQSFFRSIGSKAVVALTGLALVGFVIAHISGNLLVFAGPEALAEYAEGLRKFPALLWGLRIGLLLAFVVHVALAIRINLANKAARPRKYESKRYVKASFASRSMLLTGLLLFLFIAWHLAHYTFRVTDPEIAALGPYDVYQMLLIGFRNPINSILYIAAMVVLGLHLSHGISSTLQSFGFNSRQYAPAIFRIGPILGWLLAALYISIPVAVMLGIVK